MVDALCEHLLKNPELYLDEMALFLWEKFKVHVTTSSLSRVLNSVSWSKKKIRRVAKARNADLRDLYMHNTSDFLSYQYVFVDESGCDKRDGYRRTGWAPLGVTPVQVTRFRVRNDTKYYQRIHRTVLSLCESTRDPQIVPSLRIS